MIESGRYKESRSIKREALYISDTYWILPYDTAAHSSCETKKEPRAFCKARGRGDQCGIYYLRRRLAFSSVRPLPRVMAAPSA